VDKDLVEAYKWFYIADLGGEGVANHYLQQLRGSDPLFNGGLTLEQIAEAERRAKQWRASHAKPKPTGANPN
jgi:hypothetical protein